jgi:hypothetical protein
MAKRVLPLMPIFGGYSADEKFGPKFGYAYGRSIDHRKAPAKVTLLPAAAKDSGSTVTDLVTNKVRVANGDDYFIGQTGNFYKRTAAGTWSLVGNVGTAGCGLVYRRDQDIIYITKLTTVATYYPVSNSPSLSSTKYQHSLDQSLVSSGASTFSLATSISEGSTGRQTFTPTVEPLYSVKLWVVAKGSTADWTVTIHDDANNVIATSTVLNASLTNGALNEFVMTSAGRMLVKPNARTYHIHVTASNTTGTPTARTTTASDFETADFETYAARLISTNNGLHPAVLFQQYLCVGNERYLSVFEPLEDTPTNAEWQRHRLTFPPGLEVTSVCPQGEFLAIATEQLTSTSELAGPGIIFFWDGTATTYNFFVEIAAGSPYSLFSHQGILYFMAGGALYAIPEPGAKPIKVRQFPLTDQEYTTYSKFSINYPQMMTVRNNILLMGFPTLTQNLNIEHGVYSYGQRDKDYPNSFGYSYQISTGTILNTGSNNLRIGMVAASDPDLYIGWRDNTTYGVDRISPSSNPAATATIYSLIFDGGRPDKEKMATERILTFNALPTGATVTPYYRFNRGAWVAGTAAVAGDTELKHSINGRYKEIQFRLDFVATTVTPEVTSDTFIWDDLSSERS